jgi:hypothetical protein
VRIGIVLPTYNVENTVTVAVQQIVQLMTEFDAELLIVDNRSQDDTLKALMRLEPKLNLLPSGWSLIERPKNMGYGASIKRGFGHFLSGNLTHVMVLHSDGQSDNYRVGRDLIEAARESNADLVLGSRFLPGSDLAGYSPVRRVSNVFFNWLTKACAGKGFSDAGAAMVLLKTGCLRELDFPEMPDDWRFHPVLNIALGASDGLVVREIAVSWTDSDAGSSLPTIRYGVALFALLVAIGWRRLVNTDSWWRVSSTNGRGVKWH